MPSEIYTNGTQYLIVGAINIVVIFIVIYVYLPVFYDLQLTSVYEVRYSNNNNNNHSTIMGL